MRNIIFVLLSALLILSGATAQEDSLTLARKGIDDTNRRAVDASKARDVAAAVSLYTDDAIVMPPGEKAAAGREAITAFFTKMYSGEGVLLGQDFDRIDLMLLADGVAAESTYFHGTVRVPGRPDSEYRGKGLVIFKRQPDGTWKMHRDIWDLMK